MFDAALAVAVYVLLTGLYAICVFSFVRIFRKAGFGYWGLSSIIPVMALVLLMVLAFAEWPIAEKARAPVNGPSPLWYSPE